MAAEQLDVTDPERWLAVARRSDNQMLERNMLVNLSEAALSCEDADCLSRGEQWGGGEPTRSP